MRCSNCGTSNPRGTNFCKTCGKRLTKATPPSENVIYCGFCGLRADDDALFCTGCGRPFYDKDEDLAEKPLKTVPMVDKYTGDRRTGITKKSGRLLIYGDRIEFHLRAESSAGAVFGADNMTSERRATRKGRVEIYNLNDIKSCIYSPYALQMPAMVLTLKSGAEYKFARMNKEAELNSAAAFISEMLSAGNSRSGGKNRQLFKFEMPIKNIIPIEDYGTAIIGAVKRGKVSAGDTVYILGENDESKGSFVVKSLAVNKAIATRACAGDNDVALLLYCPPAFIKSGDKACF